uniref:Cytochrome b-c1 complex subunit 8 n=1 Tax=Strongyloides papillosus TaxID=174720 RepID=A0A0N5C272_STREA
MRVSGAALGKHFGNMGKMYGEYRFGLAPNEQKPMKGFFEQAIVKNFKNYVADQWYYYIPSGTAAYLVYDAAKKINHDSKRKDPSIYANDV